MALRDLLRKSIVDKNGKHTTVLVKPVEAAPVRNLTVLVGRNGYEVSIPDLPTQAHANVDSDGKWDGVPLEHEKLQIGGYDAWEMAPAGYSGAYCWRCASFFTEDEASEPNAKCSVCGYSQSGGHQRVGVRTTDLKFFD